jgi:uncharacterized protein YfeS
MSIKEKLEKFMQNRKRQFDTQTLSVYFMCATTTINTAMKILENENKIIKRKGKNNKNIWQWNFEYAMPKITQYIKQDLRPPIAQNAIQSHINYQHIRGYDD